MEFDLSAARAKRSSEPKTLILRNHEDDSIAAKYELHPDFPVRALDLGTGGKMSAALRELFVHPDEADEFLEAYTPGVADLVDIMQGLYGMPGEASASGR